MKEVLKHFFIPHADNNFHPHILHTKRAVFYSIVLILSKAIVFVFVLLVPTQVLVSPDILALEADKIMRLTNDLRVQQGLPPFVVEDRLQLSATAKAADMATHQYFDHLGPEGRDLHYFLTEADYPYQFAGENLAVGFTRADELVSAWVESPTHYSNIIDPDFTEAGIGLQVGAHDQNTSVYVAEHFGAREKGARALVSRQESATDLQKSESVTYSRELSHIFWERLGRGTRIWAEARIEGEFIKAEATVQGHSFELLPVGDGYFRSTIDIPESPEEVFSPVITPSIRIYGKNGEVLHDFVDWDSTLVVAPTWSERYLSVQDKLYQFTPLFSVSRTLYALFFAFFALALILNVFVQVKKQRPHVIVQTLLLLGLIGSLFVI